MTLGKTCTIRYPKQDINTLYYFECDVILNKMSPYFFCINPTSLDLFVVLMQQQYLPISNA